MIFPKKVTYGIRALLELATVYPDGQKTIMEISKATGVPKKFLGQVLLELNKGSIVRSLKGNKGGYALNASPNVINMENVARTLGANIQFAECLSGPSNNCVTSSRCKLQVFLKKQQAVLNQALKSTSLADIQNIPLAGSSDYTI